MKHPDDPARLVEDPNAPAPLVEALRAARGPAPDPRAPRRAWASRSVFPCRRRCAAGAAGPAARGAAWPPPAAAVAGVGAAKVALTGIAAVGVAAAVAVGGFGVGRGKAPPHAPVPAVVEKFEARAPEPLEDDCRAAGREPPRRRSPAPPRVAPPPPRPPRARRARRRRPPAEAPADAASRLREEAALVQRAERLLDAESGRRPSPRPRSAAAASPTGALDQEAEVVAIDALLRLGRRADATARARTFEAAHAGSLHARRIKRLMAD